VQFGWRAIWVGANLTSVHSPVASRSDASYPDVARRMHTEGDVVEIVADKSGSVSDVKSPDSQEVFLNQ